MSLISNGRLNCGNPHHATLSTAAGPTIAAASIWAIFQSKFGPETVYDAVNFKPAAVEVLSRTGMEFEERGRGI